MPSSDALNRFVKLCVSLNPGDWVHCHCHGGDGRTTTFLTLFDMVRWAKSNGTSGFPTIEDFAHRQCQIFCYCLNPVGCPETWNCKDANGDAAHRRDRLEILSRAPTLVVPRFSAHLDHQWRARRRTTIQPAGRLGATNRVCFVVLRGDGWIGRQPVAEQSSELRQIHNCTSTLSLIAVEDLLLISYNYRT